MKKVIVWQVFVLTLVLLVYCLSMVFGISADDALVALLALGILLIILNPKAIPDAVAGVTSIILFAIAGVFIFPSLIFQVIILCIASCYPFMVASELKLNRALVFISFFVYAALLASVLAYGPMLIH